MAKKPPNKLLPGELELLALLAVLRYFPTPIPKPSGIDGSENQGKELSEGQKQV